MENKSIVNTAQDCVLGLKNDGLSSKKAQKKMNVGSFYNTSQAQ